MKIESVKSTHPCKSLIQTIYDIVKAHGWELRVETIEAEGTTFTIKVPITST